jgi:hypothetical protein
VIFATRLLLLVMVRVASQTLVAEVSFRNLARRRFDPDLSGMCEQMLSQPEALCSA